MRSLIGSTSIARSSSTCSRWAGAPASPSATRTPRYLDHGPLDHNIDDPVRHDDHTAARLIIHRPHDGVEGERFAFDALLVGLPLDRKLAPLLAVDLHDIGDIGRGDEATVGDRPRALRDE